MKPMNNTEAEPYRLEQWGLVLMPSVLQSPYLAPEQRVPQLTGIVFGNPHFPDGVEVTTSRLICAVTDDIVQTMNTFYKLGEPAKAYESLFPNAKARLIARLREQCNGLADFKEPVYDGPHLDHWENEGGAHR